MSPEIDQENPKQCRQHDGGVGDDGQSKEPHVQQDQPEGSISPLLSSKVSQNAFENLADASASVEGQSPGASDLASARGPIEPCADPSAALTQPEGSPPYFKEKNEGQAGSRASVKITNKAKVGVETAVSSDAYCSLNNGIPGDAALENGDVDAADNVEPENTSPDNATAVGPELTGAQNSDKVLADKQPVDPQAPETPEAAGGGPDASAYILGGGESGIEENSGDAERDGENAPENKQDGQTNAEGNTNKEGKRTRDGGGADEDGGTTVATMLESTRADASASMASAEIPATGETEIANDANATGSTVCDGKAGQEAISKNSPAEKGFDVKPSGTQSPEATKSDGAENASNSGELQRKPSHRTPSDPESFAAAKNAIKWDMPLNFPLASFHTQHLPKRHKSQRSRKDRHHKSHKSHKHHKKQSLKHKKSSLCENGDILKEGSKVRLNEEIAMGFIAKHCPSITVPKVVHADYGKYGRIYMTKVPGVVLSDVWSQLNEETKLRVCRDIWALIEEMRNVKRPEGHFPEQKYVTMDGGYTFDPLLGDHDDPNPPLFNDQIFRERIEQRYLNAHQCKFMRRSQRMESPSLEPTSQPKVTREILHLPHCEKEVLTHGDLAPGNILVDPDTTLITAILDWESAGWYPDYWEWAKILNPWNDTDWKRHMKVTSPFKDQNWDVSGIMIARRLLH
ncbi:Phosphotransferase enzyme family protein [Ceratocystis platani]|uniref:Phosphotransferase enzyme family protein n=1 Tax=Ceratocystis fimbriata f. sp. platani TaxID=88771 RepID=A0A0F8B460_CERFI|nr:Phosphotransferase enzyme family protein [Ceratocystis platani]